MAETDVLTKPWGRREARRGRRCNDRPQGRIPICRQASPSAYDRLVLRRWAAIACAMCGVLGSTGAAAQPTVELRYQVSDSAASCPSATHMRDRIVDLLGTDRFSADGDVTVECRIDLVAGQLQADVQVSGRTGEPVGHRTISSTDMSCDELAEAIALAVTIAISGLPTEGQSPDADDRGAEARAQSSAVAAGGTATAPTSPFEPVRWSAHVSAGVHGSVTTAVAGRAGWTVGAGMRRNDLSLDIELQWFTTESVSLEPMGAVDVSIAIGVVVPCKHIGPFAACGLLGIGQLQGAGRDLVTTRSATTPYVAAGGRMAWVVDISSEIALRASLDVSASVTHTTLRVDDVAVWDTPAATAIVGLAAVGRLP